MGFVVVVVVVVVVVFRGVLAELDRRNSGKNRMKILQTGICYGCK